MKPASAKQKGRRLQQAVRDKVKAILRLGDGDIESRSTGAGGIDLPLSPAAALRFPFGVECKNTERLNIWEALEQAGKNCPAGLTPMVVFTRNRSPMYAVLPLDQLLYLLSERIPQ